MATKRIAVVTGANKGIGLEISRQLASNGVMVVLTSRDEKRGVEAVEKLNSNGLSDNLIFHQLDVMDTASVASLANFIKSHFGKLDILVNNAGVAGVYIDPEVQKGMKTTEIFGEKAKDMKEIIIQSYEGAEGCLRTNYYGVKVVCEGLIPLLQLSNSPRIVNVSSTLGLLKYIGNEKAKELGDVDTLTEEKVDEIVKGFLEDVKQNSIETKGWPINCSAYMVSKAALNAYTRVLAKKMSPKISINAVCPGHVKTDLNNHTGVLTVEEGAKGPVKLALITEAKTGLLYDRMEESTF